MPVELLELMQHETIETAMKGSMGTQVEATAAKVCAAAGSLSYSSSCDVSDRRIISSANS